MRGLALLIALQLAAAPPTPIERPVAFPPEKVIGTFGVVRDPGLRLGPMIGTTYTQTIELHAVSRLRFHVRRGGDNPAWRVSVLRDGAELWAFDRTALVEDRVWSDVLTPGRVTIVVTDSQKLVDVAVDRISERGARNVPSTVSHDPPQMYPILRQTRAIQSRGRSIALLWVEKKTGAEPCTGFLVGADLLLTAAHCVSTEEERQSTQVIFDYDGQAPRQLAKLARVEFTCPRLDVSVCRLTAKTTGRSALRPEVREVALRDKLLIIHHADGDPKQVSGADCRVTAPRVRGASDAQTDIGHSCDTNGGASGAPVFDEAGRLVATHHLGWDEDRDVLVNRAVRFSDILQAMERTPLYAEIMR